MSVLYDTLCFFSWLLFSNSWVGDDVGDGDDQDENGDDGDVGDQDWYCDSYVKKYDDIGDSDDNYLHVCLFVLNDNLEGKAYKDS